MGQLQQKEKNPQMVNDVFKFTAQAQFSRSMISNLNSFTVIFFPFLFFLKLKFAVYKKTSQLENTGLDFIIRRHLPLLTTCTFCNVITWN